LPSSDWLIDCSYTGFSRRHILRFSGLYRDIIVYSELFYNYFIAVLLRCGTMSLSRRYSPSNSAVLGVFDCLVSGILIINICVFGEFYRWVLYWTVAWYL
jgi:hypothetical protein